MTGGSATPRAPTVIGLGNTYAHDDGVGAAVAAAVADAGIPGAVVLELDGEPARVIEAWAGTPLTIVIDAACSDVAPGTVQRLEGADLAPGGRLATVRGRSSSHALGVAEALELGRALGRLPDRLVVFAVEVADLSPGPGLSPAVAAAVPGLAAAVQQELSTRTAWRIEVTGVVQGVGFRPFVWRLAHRLGISGWVRNRGGAVEVHAEGPLTALAALRDALGAEAPPAAVVREVRAQPVPPAGAAGFEVTGSGAAAGTGEPPQLPPDRAPCAACLAELADPADRRAGHPFVTCTDCGPRITIIEALPYDRVRTSMADFPLCERCALEYADPGDRRFHAEPVACPRCGPQLRLVDGRHLDLAPGSDPVAAAAARLRAGDVVAVKGVGGYQLACDASRADVVARLRRRKHRPDKPFAVLVADLDAAGRLAEVSPAERELLASPAAPIVLVAGRGALPDEVAPGHRRVGLMLPASPLHHLLARAVSGPLVLTSGNRSEEPIAVDDADALARLAGISDAWLLHDRRITTRLDDSVVAVRTTGPMVLRRARGYAPGSVTLAAPLLRPVLAVGADLANAFCLATGTDAFVSAHVGDLDDDATIAAWRRAVRRHLELVGVRPQVVAHDAHPDLQSTRLAEQLGDELGLPRCAVRHHHAHIAAVIAEHGLGGPVLGVAFDGYGLGDDGTGWGGELLVADARSYRRVGHLAVVAQPGGDLAVRHPVRMALAHADAAGCLADALSLLGLGGGEAAAELGGADPARLLTAATAPGGPRTSSIGRLFDAVAALCGLALAPTHEGQPAMALEQAALGASAPPGRWAAFGLDDPVARGASGPLVIDPGPVIRQVIADRADGRPVALVAAGFHAALVEAVADAVATLAAREGLVDVCLGGGVWANGLLVDQLAPALRGRELRVHLPAAVPPGDGGLCLGQALIAGSVGSEVS